MMSSSPWTTILEGQSLGHPGQASHENHQELMRFILGFRPGKALFWARSTESSTTGACTNNQRSQGITLLIRVKAKTAKGLKDHIEEQ